MRASLRGFSVVVIAVGVALASAACGGGGNAPQSSESGSPQRGGTLVFARTADNVSLDQTKVGDNESIWTNEQIFDPLYMVTPDGRDLKPWLATSYDRSANNTKFTYHLRKGVKFSNGKPMTAEDVAWSINRARTSGTGLTYIDEPIKDVTAPDASTVVVTTKRPWAPTPAIVSFFANAIIPKDFAGMSEKEFFEKPIGTGPFMVKEWQHGDHLTLVRNPNYWQKGKPYLDSIRITNVSDDNQRILQLKGGQAQIIRFPPSSAMNSLASAANLDARGFPSTRVDYLLMNQKVKPYDDVHVRRAISYAIDRNALVKAALFGQGKPADSYLAPSEAFYVSQPDAYSYDLDKAKQEIAASSVPNGFTTTYLTSPGDKFAEIIQQELKQIGIDMTIKNIDVNQIFEVQGKGEYEITPEYWTEDIPDPDERTAWFLNESASHDYFTYHQSTKMRSLVLQSEKIFDEAQRGAIYKQIQELHAEEMPQVPLTFSPYNYAWSTKVHGFFVSPLGNFHMEDVWLEK
jgi:peptide/nickel transport system substrate-binding protein